MELQGHCADIESEAAKENFKEEFETEVALQLGIDKSRVEVSNIKCGSILVTFIVTGVSGKANILEKLEKLVKSGKMKVTVNSKTYTATRIIIISPTTPVTQAPTTEAVKNEVALILFITFGALMAVIFIVVIIVLILRCRRDRREGSFFFNYQTTYELRRFQGVPRARNYSKVNYYGDPVELDATAVDPDSPEEFQAQAGDNPYNRGTSSLDRVKPIAAANNDEQFNVAAMALPEWKDLPKLTKSEVTVVGDPKQGISKSAGSVGSRKHLLDDESLPADSEYAYDNPIITFGDGTSGSKREEDLEPHAYDNPVMIEDAEPPAPEKEDS